jgi:nicotinate phosphoribosyltransferase
VGAAHAGREEPSTTGTAPWVTDANAALLTDLYELTMLQAYWREGMLDEAVFTLFVRRLPPSRNYLLVCGLDDALRYLERVRFDRDALDFLAGLGHFRPEFLEWLAAFRFTGDVYAVPEGTPVFADEPILEVVAPLPEAQLAETFVMNQVHFQTVIASKAARIVQAAEGRAVVDFGLRRMHGADAGIKAARACYVAGAAATSNVLAGRLYGVPVAGTMAHSYVQAHDRELDAFRSFAALYPTTILLVDTYDSIEGVKRVIALARELGDAFQVRGVRLDSGDLAALAFEARALLDEAGLSRVEIFASGGLDEHVIAGAVQRGAPISAFGVGSSMAVAQDAPALDIAYKLAAYGGTGRLKLSPGKGILPGQKQVFRREDGGIAAGDVIARWGEALPGRPLLVRVMERGARLPAGGATVEQARVRARSELERLPDRLRALAPADPPYPVTLSDALAGFRRRVAGAAGR